LAEDFTIILAYFFNKQAGLLANGSLLFVQAFPGWRPVTSFKPALRLQWRDRTVWGDTQYFKLGYRPKLTFTAMLSANLRISLFSC